MNTTTASATSLPTGAPAAARTVLRLLQRLQTGTLDLQCPDGTQLHFGNAAHPEPRAALRIKNWDVCSAVLRSGDVGFGESYIAGDWTSPDLAALLRLLLANREAVDQAMYGTWWGSLLHRLKHLLNRNSRKGSRRNIQAHYDLGNPFYKLWLDETMNYSSAWFNGDQSQPLAQAQAAKMQRALDECGIRPGDKVLEIGCGWGAVAECGVRDRNLNMVGVTLSTEQLAWAQERVARLPAGHQADLRLQDYRDIPETGFDAVVSIEMFEAVGREYWGQFFRSVHDKLKPGGRACIQSITIRDDLFERYVRGTDFIQQYVFPGGLLPSPSTFRAAAAEQGLKVVNQLAFGTDYAETLRRWRHDFMGQDNQVRQLGYDANFVRLWEFYLAYCEAAFDAGSTNVMQFTLQRD
ncbi:MAG: SAM-dependent methyltransferase [Burkholderiales bacterium PBB6]|nr:MAG: SAM-dependent methyltransferase [Burkholderiales bacterium PBB6]